MPLNKGEEAPELEAELGWITGLEPSGTVLPLRQALRFPPVISDPGPRRLVFPSRLLRPPEYPE